jgi:hypothetical protein
MRRERAQFTTVEVARQSASAWRRARRPDAVTPQCAAYRGLLFWNLPPFNIVVLAWQIEADYGLSRWTVGDLSPKPPCQPSRPPGLRRVFVERRDQEQAIVASREGRVASAEPQRTLTSALAAVSLLSFR